MATFARPENALKRAEEFVNVGQKQAALQALHDLITSKRYRAWQKTHEKIMFKYVELCVDMRKGRFAKDGLIQYRNICQQVNVSSLEEVIKHFMQLSTERAEQARSQAHTLEDALDVDDLEADRRPEDLMLSYVSGEKGKEKSDRELVTPWFKFLWEAYRTVLEILKNNSKLETLYAMTAHRAFQFCKQYKRTTEFRRLCDIIRNHFANLNKYKDQRDRPDLTIPESLQLSLDTRVEQLKIATDLELWQEAFRSVEDIYGLMTSVKKSPKPSVMVTYYAKLSEICWVSESYLYHSYAWLKIFNLQKTYNKNLTQKDLQLIASSVVLAALSVTLYDHKHGASHMELENEKERSLRMANLIGFGLDSKREVLSRASLFADLASKGVMNCVSQEVKDLYNLLEHETLQLDLASKVHPLLMKISKHGANLSSASSVPEVQLSRYISAIEKLTTLRVLQQASKMYRTMKIEMLSKIVPFFDFSVVEKISVDAVEHNFIAMKVDHVKSIVLFGNLDIESDCLCGHLSTLTSSLDKARSLIYPSMKRAPKLSQNLFGLADLVEKEHKRLLARKSIIEKRKEEQERQILQKEQDQAIKKREADKIIKQLEIKRCEEDRLKREKEKQIREKKLIDSQELKTFLEKFSKKKGKGPIIEPEKITKEVLIEEALREQLRERQEKEKKLQKLTKTMDYLERAKREVETPLIQQAFNQRLMEGKVIHESEQMKEIELSKQRHVGDLKEKNRLTRMLDNKMIFEDRITHKREAECNQLKKEREDHNSQIKVSRKSDREMKRKLVFYLRSEEERLTRLRKQEEARKLEEVERKKREEVERKARLDEIAERQRQRERELEEKERKIKLDEIAERQRQRERELEEIERRRSGSAEPRKAADPDPAKSSSEPPVAPARAPGKFVPSVLRGKAPQQQSSSSALPESDRWGRRDDRPSAYTDTWRSGNRRPAPGAPELQNSRRDDRPPALSSSSALPEPERWGRRDYRPPASISSSALTEPERGAGRNDHPPVSSDIGRSGDRKLSSNGSADGSKSSGDDNLKPSDDSAGGSKSSFSDRWTSSRQR